MPIEEMIKTRHRISLEIAGMTVEEMNAYFAKGAGELQKRIDALRAEKEKKQATAIAQ